MWAHPPTLGCALTFMHTQMYVWTCKPFVGFCTCPLLSAGQVDLCRHAIVCFLPLIMIDTFCKRIDLRQHVVLVSKICWHFGLIEFSVPTKSVTESALLLAQYPANAIPEPQRTDFGLTNTYLQGCAFLCFFCCCIGRHLTEIKSNFMEITNREFAIREKCGFTVTTKAFKK